MWKYINNDKDSDNSKMQFWSKLYWTEGQKRRASLTSAFGDFLTWSVNLCLSTQLKFSPVNYNH